jgi:hypothetical protein
MDPHSRSGRVTAIVTSRLNANWSLSATAALAVAAALMFGGCGITDPYRSSSLTPPLRGGDSGTSQAAQSGNPAPDGGGTISGRAHAGQGAPAGDAGSRTPQAAIERYASLYINWDAANLAAHQRELASISLGQARAQALQAAAGAARDPRLTGSHVANTGEVVSIGPGQGGAAGQWVLVTSERTSGQGDYSGLPPNPHVVFVRLMITSAGWVVSAWQPQD